MNNLNVKEDNVLFYKDKGAMRVKELKERTPYACTIDCARFFQPKNELQLVWTLCKEESNKNYYVLNYYNIDSDEFNLLMERVYANHTDIIAVNLEDFLDFAAYCEVKFVDGYPKVIICDSNVTPINDLAMALYGDIL